MKFWLLWIGIVVAVCACGGDDVPLPTPIDPDQAREEAGLPSEAEIAATQTALVPTATIYLSPTASLTPSDTPTLVPTETTIPSITPTFSSIQQTAIYLANRQTEVAGTATALVRPTDTLTFTPSATYTPSETPTSTLTPSPTLALAPRSAPNRIVFTSNRAGSFDIWMMDLDGGNPTPLTLSPDLDEMTATCSQDGTRLIFDRQREKDRELYLETLGQTDERPLTDTEGDNYAPAWSPLAEVVAFLSTRDGQLGVWLMDSGGGNARKLTTLAGEYGPPQWSPDGKLILYAANRGGQFDLYVYDIASNTETQLTDTTDVNESLPSLGYDLASIAYIAELDPQDPQTGAMWLLNQPIPVVTAGGRVDTPMWIDNEKVLLSANLGGITHILLVDVQQHRQTLLSNLGPSNLYPRPCYYAAGGDAIPLPLGDVPTPTPSATPNLVSAYIPVVNPGGDWRDIVVELSLAELETLAPQDFRLGAAEAILTDGLITYQWTTENGDASQVTVALSNLAGSLDVKLSDYQVDGRPVGVNSITDLAFVIREAILSRFLNVGLYHLRGVQMEETRITFTFAIPPN